jgi:ribosomal protein S18 acetylase RimI-like enzyme
MIKDRAKKPEAGEQAAAGKVRYRVKPLADPEAIRPILEQQPAYAAYALAHLEPRLFPRSYWWRAVPLDSAGSLPVPAGGEALVMQARTGLGPSLVALGAPEALEAILRLHPGPFYTFATFQIEHTAVARRHFSLSRRGVSLRLSVSRETFQPADGAARRLRGRDLADVDALQRSEGFGFHSAAALDDGVYYGVYHADRLVAMAGTHVVAPQMGVAIVGNVVTHPHYRRRGYGTMATGAVTAALLETCPTVLLTAEETNEPALHIYRRLGYRLECRLIESGARRKDAFGLVSLLRRWWARRRGGAGWEVVTP